MGCLNLQKARESLIMLIHFPNLSLISFSLLLKNARYTNTGLFTSLIALLLTKENALCLNSQEMRIPIPPPSKKKRH